jgi:hypothetical protein
MLYYTIPKEKTTAKFFCGTRLRLRKKNRDRQDFSDFPAENKKNGHKGTKAQRRTFIIKILGVFVS